MMKRMEDRKIKHAWRHCRSRWKQCAGIGLSAVLIFTASYGCGRQKTTDEAQEREPVTFSAIFTINPETGVVDKKEIADAFNLAYEGQYHLDVDYQMFAADAYRDRIKELHVQDKLPTIITDVAIDTEFYEMLVNNDRLVDLSEYMDDEWRNAVRSDVLKQCSEVDGSIYLSPIASPIYSFSGIFYNRVILASAGYDTVPSDWEGFFECLDKLASMGYTPLSLHGSENFWSPMLLATAYLARNTEGQLFLSEQFPQNYDTTQVRDMFTMLKRLYDYTYDDALDVGYETAQSRFLAGETAMLANGYWILETLTKDQQEKFGFAPFPGNVLMASPSMTAWSVTTGYDEATTKAAVEFLKYRTLQSKESSDAFVNSGGSAILRDYKTSVKKAVYVFPNYQLKWSQRIQNSFFNEYLSQYIQNAVSLDDFIAEMNNAARRSSE